QDYDVWMKGSDHVNKFPYISDIEQVSKLHGELNFISINVDDYDQIIFGFLEKTPPTVLILHSDNAHTTASIRRFVVELVNRGIKVPVILKYDYPTLKEDQLMIYASTDAGTLLVDGIGDGIILSPKEKATIDQLKLYNNTAFGILQAARTRITKTEYISCPSCGRTLFDLQETTAMIRKRTDHLKGVKIGIMGCTVNGPGEMADADFGYVGSGKGKITLYKGQEVMKRGIPTERALDELIDLIKEHGRWVEPETEVV
ncbi:MAG: flavodoxin-dependent (E)-4-hydroxy-3-methylbut-2-enyl-diphosphate synthase, partial [Bacteroidota bacterium]